MRASRPGRMRFGRSIVLGVAVCWLVFAPAAAQTGPAQPIGEITVSGIRFLANGQPFPYTGMSFFNAIYNPAFNASSAQRLTWLWKFRKYGINVLRVWCQWDNTRGFVDGGAGKTMYHPDGRLRSEHLATLKAILADANTAGIAVELVFFSQESYRENIRLSAEASARAVRGLTEELRPYRNLTFQIWNEHTDDQVLPLAALIKSIDKRRLVSNSPGVAGFLGDPPLNTALDYLTPHTSRQGSGRHWEIAPTEIAYLLERFRKPVVDDEPARNGTAQFGGPREVTSPYDHILQIWQVWQLGGYITYHHDMFQTGYGTPAVPPSGVPDPEFSAYHRQVFEYIAGRERHDRKDSR
jgi:hypothetical protein